MTDIQKDLRTIDEINVQKRRLEHDARRAVEAVAERVVDNLFGNGEVGMNLHFLANNEHFTTTLAGLLTARNQASINERAELAELLEDKGGEHGAEAARILRQMNAISNEMIMVASDVSANTVREIVSQMQQATPGGVKIVETKDLLDQPAGGPFDSQARNDRPVEPNPNAPHVVIHPGAQSFTLNVGESGAWVSFADEDGATVPMTVVQDFEDADTPAFKALRERGNEIRAARAARQAEEAAELRGFQMGKAAARAAVQSRWDKVFRNSSPSYDEGMCAALEEIGEITPPGGEG
jgi:hypothetical protein